jgi:hypothetical protein
MKMRKVDHPRHGQNQPSDRGIYHLSFREIYEVINYRNDFNAPQLFYLSRLVSRKLEAFDPRFTASDSEANHRIKKMV